VWAETRDDRVRLLFRDNGIGIEKDDSVARRGLPPYLKNCPTLLIAPHCHYEIAFGAFSANIPMMNFAEYAF